MSDPGLNETLQKLSSSINQQAAASINSINVPEFRGLPDEDVYDFLKRFKMATLTLSDEYRCLALNKALKGAALTWAKATIKKLIIEANWSAIKAELYNRFGSSDRVLRFREKLAKLKFLEGQSTLMAYIELYLATYKKAFKVQQDSDVILSLRLNLPDKIVRGLNSLDDSWSEYTEIPKFIDLVKRYEAKILPYDAKINQNGNSLTKETLYSMFKELRGAINEDLKKHKEEIKPEVQALAALAHSSSPKPQRNERYQYNRYQRPNHHYQRNYKRPRYDNHNSSGQWQRNGDHRAHPAIAQQDMGKDLASGAEQKDRLEAYYARFGKPPAPCHFCQGKHLNRHCPLLSSNLN